jgi:RNA polymerase sigma factor (sigma-70 family)
MDRYAYALDQLRQDDFKRLRSYAPEEGGKFELWLVVVVRRLCLDHYRQRYGRSRPSSRAGAGAPADRGARRRVADLFTNQAEPSTLADNPRLQPDAELAAKERTQALETALGRLGPRDRLLLKLRFEDELSAREIAGLMRFSTPFHVYRRLTSVVRTLGTLVRQSGIEGGES